MVRAALHAYFALARRFPEENPTASELRDLKRTRQAMARGESVTLDEVDRELENPPVKGRRIIARPTATTYRKRSGGNISPRDAPVN